MSLLQDIERELSRVTNELVADIAAKDRLDHIISAKMVFKSRLQDLIDKAKREQSK